MHNAARKTDNAVVRRQAALVVCCMAVPRPRSGPINRNGKIGPIRKRRFPTTHESKLARVQFGPHGQKGMFNVAVDELNTPRNTLTMFWGNARGRTSTSTRREIILCYRWAGSASSRTYLNLRDVSTQKGDTLDRTATDP